MPKIQLNDGNSIPQLGLGTYRLTGKNGKEAILYALNNNYNHIDTAAFYRNEEEVGNAIRESGRSRRDIFITSKVWSSDLGYEATKNAFNESIQKLDLEYLDLYLIHWPGNSASDRIGSWKAMLELKREGKIKSIGVSNFSISQLNEIANEYGKYPVINQVKYSPFSQKRELLRFCNNNDIRITAYTPLEKGNKFNHPVISEIASNHGKTAAQVMLRWSIEKGLIVIPKSSNPNRIKENSQIFDFQLNNIEMEKMDKL